MSKISKKVFLSFDMLGTLDEKLTEKIIDNSWQVISACSFVSNNYNPVIPCKIKSFSIEGKSDFFDSGVLITGVQDATTQQFSIDHALKSDRKISVVLQDTGNGSSAYVVQLVLKIEKEI